MLTDSNDLGRPVSDADLVAECKRRGFKVYAPERIKAVDFARPVPLVQWDAMRAQSRWVDYEKRHMAGGIADFMLRHGAFTFDATPFQFNMVLTLAGCVVLPKPKEDACSPKTR